MEEIIKTDKKNKLLVLKNLSKLKFCLSTWELNAKEKPPDLSSLLKVAVRNSTTLPGKLHTKG